MLHAAFGEEAEVLHAAVVDAESAPGVADGAAELGELPHEGAEAIPGRPGRNEILQHKRAPRSTCGGAGVCVCV